MQGKNENMYCIKDETPGTLASRNYGYNSLLKRQMKYFQMYVCLVQTGHYCMSMKNFWMHCGNSFRLSFESSTK